MEFQLFAGLKILRTRQADQPFQAGEFAQPGLDDGGRLRGGGPSFQLLDPPEAEAEAVMERAPAMIAISSMTRRL